MFAQINWVPAGKPSWHQGWMNNYVRGLGLILNYLGQKVDYITMIGDTGQAFIMQGEERNRINGAVDIGWWPLEPMTLIRLNFLGKTAGWEIKEICSPETENKNWFEPIIYESLSNQKPCIAFFCPNQYIITGIDDQIYPLLGICPNVKQGLEKIQRIEESTLPFRLLVLGEKQKQLDRLVADLESLTYAVSLHQEKVLLPENPYTKWGWHTGRETYMIWIRCLEDFEHIGEGRWHDNAFWHLEWNRKIAIMYLREMQKRYDGEVIDIIESACQKWEALIGEIQKADTSDTNIRSKQGRLDLIQVIRKALTLEEEAFQEITKAVIILKKNDTKS